MDSPEEESGPRIAGRVEHRFPKAEFDDAEGSIAMQALQRVAAQLRTEDPDMPDTDRPGAPIGVAWNVAFSMFGVPFVCLLVADRPDPGSANIPKVVRLPAPGIRQRMLYLLSAGSNLQAYTHDGLSGHVVNLVALRGDRIVYSDPEPGDSLLCARHNAAGVDAKPFGNTHWTVTPDELMRVLIGLFVFPSDWAAVCGEPGRPRYSDVVESEFCRNSHLQVTARTTDETGHTRITALPMGEEGNVRLELILDPMGGVAAADVALRTEAVLGGEDGIEPVFLHVARLFVLDFLPVADRVAGERLLRGLDIAYVHERMGDPAYGETAEGQLTRTFLGDLPDITFTFELAGLTVHHDDPDWITLQINTF